MFYAEHLERHRDLGIDFDSVYVLSHLNDNMLVDQTISRLDDLMVDANFNVFHPAKAFLKKESTINKLSTNRILICD